MSHVRLPLALGGGPAAGAAVLGVGCDVVAHAEVADAWERFGARYVHRWCAQAEASGPGSPWPVGADGGSPTPRAVRALAARLAAKESVLKALGGADGRPWRWRDLQVRPDLSAVVCTGTAAGTARRILTFAPTVHLTWGRTGASTQCLCIVTATCDVAGGSRGALSRPHRG